MDPLLAASEAIRKEGIDVRWDARSLQGFEETSIEEMARDYDLIAIDHPFMGKAFEQHALMPVDALLGESTMRILRASSVGVSLDSYVWQGATWAVPVDAAAQVAAGRQDLLSRHGLRFPVKWDDVFALCDALPEGAFVAMPANPTHLLLAFATFCQAVTSDRTIQTDLRPGWWTDEGFEADTAMSGLRLLRRFMAYAHPLSWEWDPIGLFEHMVRQDDILYTPVAFGYSNYARPEVGDRPLIFRGVPSLSEGPGSGMLGGVGLAVARRCAGTPGIDAIARFLTFVSNANVQSGLYLDAGGQPAHRAAWEAPHTEMVCPHFFADTLTSLDASFVRPRIEAYPAFQRQGGELLHTLFRDPTVTDEQIVRSLNKLWQSLQD
jgi:multiple sugar transport system substrate-binding protein